ncbi:MAG: hypothetical protein ABSG81_13135 [Acidimicrobiales bacterium]|jgi:protein-tyrosine phosphatase
MGVHVLFVCTGNTYRSPMAEGFARGAIRERGLDCTVSSAGILPGERPMPSTALKVVEVADPSMADHRSRRLAPDIVRHADVVVGMAREHVREAVVLDPDAWPRSFTLKEIVRRGEAVGARRAGQPLPSWLALVGAGRARTELLGSSPFDDVPDPLGAPNAEVRRTAREIRVLVDQFLDLIFPVIHGGW